MDISIATRMAVRSLASAIMALGCASLSPAAAQSPTVVVQGERLTEVHRTVPYGDLNLAEPRGRDRLMRRVRYAIEGLCERQDYFSTLGPPDRECENSGWLSANPQLDTVFSRVGSSLTAASLLVSVQK